MGDGHDFPGLVDERVPGIAAVIDDVAKDLKTRFDNQFWRMNCQMFSWLLSSGARGGSGRSEMLPGSSALRAYRAEQIGRLGALIVAGAGT